MVMCACVCVRVYSHVRVCARMCIRVPGKTRRRPCVCVICLNPAFLLEKQPRLCVLLPRGVGQHSVKGPMALQTPVSGREALCIA